MTKERIRYHGIRIWRAQNPNGDDIRHRVEVDEVLHHAEVVSRGRRTLEIRSNEQSQGEDGLLVHDLHQQATQGFDSRRQAVIRVLRILAGLDVMTPPGKNEGYQEDKHAVEGVCYHDLALLSGLSSDRLER